MLNTFYLRELKTREYRDAKMKSLPKIFNVRIIEENMAYR